MSEALRQVVWKCDRCGGDAQAIFGIFPSCKCGSTSFKAAQPPAPTAQPSNAIEDPVTVPRGLLGAACSALDFGRDAPKTLAELRRYTIGDLSQPVQQPGAEPMQGGMDNAELLAAWKNKLPGVEPSDAQLTAFAVGVEVGFAHARDLERQDWSRVHHALAKHGVHPGRTDDHLADVIDRALAAPAQRQPLPPGLRLAAAFTRADLGPDGSNYPHVRELLAFAEQALGITAAPAAQKGEKL